MAWKDCDFICFNRDTMRFQNPTWLTSCVIYPAPDRLPKRCEPRNDTPLQMNISKRPAKILNLKGKSPNITPQSWPNRELIDLQRDWTPRCGLQLNNLWNKRTSRSSCRAARENLRRHSWKRVKNRFLKRIFRILIKTCFFYQYIISNKKYCPKLGQPKPTVRIYRDHCYALNMVRWTFALFANQQPDSSPIITGVIDFIPHIKESRNTG